MPLHYILFSLPSCSKCPSVKRFLAGFGMKGAEIDASNDAGLAKATEHNVMSTPTVIFLDDSGREVCRGQSIEELQRCLKK